jgi:signal peptidase I
LRLAIAMLLAPLAAFALVCWPRWILNAGMALALLGFLLLLFVAQLLGPVVIAIRNKRGPAARYNRWWFYLLWFVVSSALYQGLLAWRPVVFGYEMFRTPADSMAPTLVKGDFFVVDTWRFREQAPAVGDIVVFHRDDGTIFVRRVVGIPGDRIELRDGIVRRNDRPLVEPYLHEPTDLQPFMRDVAPVLLGPAEYYVLGDHRDNSRDSRTFGPIERHSLHGRVEYILFSLAGGTLQWNRTQRYLVMR